MIIAELMEQTQQFLNLTVPGDQGLDAKVRQLIEAEHLRKLAQYRRVDLAMVRKYGMDFEEFLARRVRANRITVGRWNRTPWRGKVRSGAWQLWNDNCENCAG